MGAQCEIVGVLVILGCAWGISTAENMALTIARGQLARGENPPPNTTAMLVMALDRLSGEDDWTRDEEADG